MTSINPNSPSVTKACSRCRAEFPCGPAGEHSRCWCADLPHVMPLDAAADCLCPDCLQAAIRDRVDARTEAGQP